MWNAGVYIRLWAATIGLPVTVELIVSRAAAHVDDLGKKL